mmetsp:Transcript_27145/g.65897  ORF Transcript_27145/g.65897 Transcript_27145/m.65897 type:complete len:85 (-) Transcript_27145:638-892(-)
MVDNRWAIEMIVLSLAENNSCKACWTKYSLWASKALVASSKMIMGDSLAKTRAKAIRCRWPPDNWVGPTMVSKPFGKPWTNSHT